MTTIHKQLQAIMSLQDRSRSLADIAEQEAREVAELGERIGYGRIIQLQLCERLWGEKLPGGVSPAAYASKRLRDYDEREPLVKELLSRIDCMQPAPVSLVESVKRVRDFKIGGA